MTAWASAGFAVALHGQFHDGCCRIGGDHSYLKAQLQAFASSGRRNDISPQMRNIARAAYYASQPPDVVKAVD